MKTVRTVDKIRSAAKIIVKNSHSLLLDMSHVWLVCTLNVSCSL
jgi:hypothetical protein